MMDDDKDHGPKSIGDDVSGRRLLDGLRDFESGKRFGGRGRTIQTKGVV